MNGASFELLGKRVREDLERHDDLGRPSEARIRRMALLQSETRARRPRRVLALAAATLALAALALVFGSGPTRPEQPLRFWIEDRVGKVDDWVKARDSEQSLRFSDGSSVIAAPQTTTRVMQITPDGARLTLERGRIDAHVVHREDSHWQVAAGPFVVRVTGTRFRVNWDPQTETLAVRVSEGRVEVTGGGHPKHELTAGSGLELHVVGEQAESEASNTPEPQASAALEAPAPPSEADEASAAVGRAAKSERKPDWRELSTGGHYREALGLVEQLGFDSQCASLPARDLLSLASTARLAGRADRARQAYLAARERFPGSPQAAISAFSLGRLASETGQGRDAVTWFGRYLAEQPGGPLAREASGRLLELYRAQNDARARRAAEAYLKRYPAGPHAPLARSILASSSESRLP